jgi:hydroxypyruvate isomerase
VPRFAANLTMMFTEVPFLQRFAAAGRAGFDAVEFLFPYEHPADEVAEAARDAGVEIVLFNMPPGDWSAGDRGIASLLPRAGEFTAGVRKTLEYSRRLGVPRVHMMAGLASSADAAAQARYRDALTEAADAFAADGVTVLIEPINRRDMPGYFLDDFDRAAAIIANLERPNIALQFDIYHRQILHGDVATALERLLPIVGHVQVASVPLRHEPGSGELNDGYLFALLDRLGYSGFVGCEYRPAAGTAAGLGWFSGLGRPHSRPTDAA